jgi:hypothetical protein
MYNIPIIMQEAFYWHELVTATFIKFVINVVFFLLEMELVNLDSSKEKKQIKMNIFHTIDVFTKIEKYSREQF